jgi:hypothetical protein
MNISSFQITFREKERETSSRGEDGEDTHTAHIHTALSISQTKHRNRTPGGEEREREEIIVGGRPSTTSTIIMII